MVPFAVRFVVSCSTVTMICLPARVVRQIHQRKHVGAAPIIPLVSVLANSHVWLLFGYLAKTWFPTVACFAFGDLMALGYLAIYWRYTTERRYVARVLAVVFAALIIPTIYVIVGVLGYTGQTREQVNDTMGCICDAIVFCINVATMEKVFQIVRHKSAALVNVRMVLLGMVNSGIWFTYGVFAHSWYIISVHILVLTLGTATLGLYVLYGPKTHPVADSRTATDEDRIVLSIDLSPKADLGVKALPSPEYEAMRSPLGAVHR